MFRLIPLLVALLLLTACPDQEPKGIVLTKKAPSSSVAKKKQIFKSAPKQMRHCKPCHTYGKEGGKKIGPNLFGIVGVKVGQAGGFNYSKAFAEGEWRWTRENIRLIISRSTGAATDAIKKFSGDSSAKTNMKFYGASDADAEIILNYLETLK